MIISLIAAISDNNVIGKTDGGLPWQLPRDSQHFRTYTAGKWMVLGRRTYSEMIGWFTDQTPIVVTKNLNILQHGKMYVVQSVDAAITTAKQFDVDELVISGGSKLYKAALPSVQKMILTRVKTTISDESVQFPEVDWQNWQLESTEDWPADAENAYPMQLEVWQRCG